MTDPVRSTKLEAVNIMLSTIGSAPVSTLLSSGLGHANFAIAILDEQTRRLQNREWHFNTEYDYPLTPNGSGNLVPPTNATRVDQMRCHDGQVDCTYRDGVIYDKKARTSVFTRTDLTFKLVLAFEFEKLPEFIRNYVTIKSARTFQERILGSDSLELFTRDDEQDAMVLARRADNDVADYNILKGHDTYQILNRQI